MYYIGNITSVTSENQGEHFREHSNEPKYFHEQDDWTSLDFQEYVLTADSIYEEIDSRFPTKAEGHVKKTISCETWATSERNENTAKRL